VLHDHSVTMGEKRKMGKSGLKKMRMLERTFNGRLVVPFKVVLRIIKNSSELTPNLQVSKKEFSDTSVTHDQLQRINAQLLRMERQKAEAIWLIREKQRCL